MATFTRKTKVIGNPGSIIGLIPAGNPGRRSKNRKKVQTMAKTRKRAKSRPSGSSTKARSKGRRRNPGRRAGSHRHRSVARRRNPGNIGSSVSTAMFIIAGAVGSKLGAQLVLGSKNTGTLGYVGNAGAGAALFFLFDKVFKNRAAAIGILYGTLVQIILRVLNDFTPLGQYFANIGMGDYMMQSFVTPQVLVAPNENATLANGWNPPPMPMLAPASPASAVVAAGMGQYDLYSARGLYA